MIRYPDRFKQLELFTENNICVGDVVRYIPGIEIKNHCVIPEMVGIVLDVNSCIIQSLGTDRCTYHGNRFPYLEVIDHIDDIEPYVSTHVAYGWGRR